LRFFSRNNNNNYIYNEKGDSWAFLREEGTEPFLVSFDVDSYDIDQRVLDGHDMHFIANDVEQKRIKVQSRARRDGEWLIDGQA
jgi:hypothetical protein